MSTDVLHERTGLLSSLRRRKGLSRTERDRLVDAVFAEDPVVPPASGSPPPEGSAEVVSSQTPEPSDPGARAVRLATPAQAQRLPILERDSRAAASRLFLGSSISEPANIVLGRLVDAMLEADYSLHVPRTRAMIRALKRAEASVKSWDAHYHLQLPLLGFETLGNAWGHDLPYWEALSRASHLANYRYGAGSSHQALGALDLVMDPNLSGRSLVVVVTRSGEALGSPVSNDYYEVVYTSDEYQVLRER